ncbi:MAG TPA: universal stress protein UspA, partial [Rhizobiales bacterium]|nr:universal stress protein UspA [Hyphomicrobiales bacterium]
MENLEAQRRDEQNHIDTAPVSLKRILVALDASPFADRALEEAVRLAGSAGGVVTGIHAYAAKLHDHRFRQMEGGLPERYKKEGEMEHQRVVHDDLITRGLGLISESYHDTAQGVCDRADVPFRRLSPEGKNYRRLVEAASSGKFDVLALGAQGLGVTPGGMIGTVCERTVRRSPIDVLIVRNPKMTIGEGPVVVALDGSPRSFGALKTGFDLARRLNVRLHAVAAYDPYFHYVAFDRIAVNLSEEAGETFKFKEQEQLHEEIIDSGIARIYQSHLDVALSVAGDEGIELTTELLEGKPYTAIAAYLEAQGASLLIAGKTGVHADPDLDIGGNAENLMRMSPCHVWLSTSTYTPPFDAVARETISWTDEAEAKMLKVPETARKMVRMAILRLAQESGHTVITTALIEEATKRFCPDRGGRADDAQPMNWSDEARAMLEKNGDPSLSASIRLSAEKRARREKADFVDVCHVRPFIDGGAAPAPVW